MLKIVDVHLSASATGEYVVLQNQGLTTVSLRGWALCGDSYLSGNAYAAAAEMFVFADDVPIKPYVRVVLFSGQGEPGWCPTVDGKYAYLVYWCRPGPAWTDTGSIHLLHLSQSRRLVQPADEVLAIGA